MLLEDLPAIKEYNITTMSAHQSGSAQIPVTKDPREILRILQLNIEELCRAKHDYLLNNNQIDVL